MIGIDTLILLCAVCFVSGVTLGAILGRIKPNKP